MKKHTKVLFTLSIILFCVGYFYKIAIFFGVVILLLIFLDNRLKKKNDRLSKISTNDNIKNFKPKKTNTFSKNVETRFKEKRLRNDKKS